MRDVTITCNKCRAVIDRDVSVVQAVAGALRLRLENPVDLCGPCGAALVDWLKNPPAAEKAA